MKLLYLFLLLIQFSISNHIIAQKQGQVKIDSLVITLKNLKEDSNKVNTLNRIAHEFRSSIPDTSIILSTQALSLALKLKWEIGVGKSYHNLGDYNQIKGNNTKAVELGFRALSIWDKLLNNLKLNNNILDFNQRRNHLLQLKAKTLGNIGIGYDDQGIYINALKYYFNALEIGKELSEKNIIGTQLGNIGIVYKRKGDYPRALEYHFKALRNAEEIGDKNKIARQLNGIGSVYLDYSNIRGKQVKSNDTLHVNALLYYLKALKMAEELGSKQGIAIVAGNIGLFYASQANYQKAFDYYARAIKNNEELGNNFGLALDYERTGQIYFQQENYSKALDYFYKALKIGEEIESKNQIERSMSNIGLTYLNQKNFIKSKEFFLKSIRLSSEIGDMSSLKSNYNNLSQLDSSQGNFKSAYNNYKLFIWYRDSVFSEQKTREITQLEMNYEFDKKEAATKTAQDKRDAIAKAELEKQKLIKNSIAGGSGIIILSSLFSFFFYKRKRDAEQKQKETSLSLQVSETEMKALRSQMNPHFIFNALSSIQTFLMTHQPEDANKYLLKFSKLMRLVLENSQHREISLKKDMEALELYMQLESIRLAHPFTYQFHIDDSVDVDNDTIPPLILQPFVENAIWHGLQQKTEAGHINIYISKRDNALYAIVEDNGVGRDMSKHNQQPMLMKKESLGMKLTEERLKILNEIKKIEAQFKITDLFSAENKPNGTKVELSLPLG